MDAEVRSNDLYANASPEDMRPILLFQAVFVDTSGARDYWSITLKIHNAPLSPTDVNVNVETKLAGSVEIVNADTL